MKKIKDFILKYDNIFVFIVILMVTSIFSLNTKFYVSDEQWNFGNIYKMINGGMIYVDNNVIITPLFFLIGKMLLITFGVNFVTFRIYGLIIYASLIFCSYLLLKQIGIKRNYSFLVSLFLLNTAINIAVGGANYNLMAMTFVFIGIIVQNSKLKNNYKSIIEGILLFIVFFTKQNIGTFYIIGLIVYQISEIKGKEKNVKKEIIKALFIELLIAFVCLVVAIIIMNINGCLEGFINYCVLGIGEFNKNLATDHIVTVLLDIGSIALLIILNLFIEKIFKANNKKESEKKLILIECICMLFVQYPIFNTYHIEISFFLHKLYLAIILAVLIDEFLNDNKKKKINKAMNIASITIVIGGIILAIVHFNFYLGQLKKSYINERYKMYYGMNIKEDHIKSINKITEYILNEKNKGNKVIIISYKAMIYNIPAGINNKAFDLPFIGNFGADGEKGMIEKISSMKNTKILITKDEKDKLFQESKKIRDFIISNLEYENDIEEYMIYSTK